MVFICCLMKLPQNWSIAGEGSLVPIYATKVSKSAKISVNYSDFCFDDSSWTDALSSANLSYSFISSN